MKIERLLRLMNILLERDANIPKGKVKMYCVGVNRKEILIGENKYIISKQVKYDYPHFSALHAELDFFHKARKENFYPSDIFVFGYRKNLLKNTRPCLYCASILNELDFKRIHFFEEGKIITLTKEEFERALDEEVFKDYT
ncbi:hypothetical protein YS40_136 [Thermus phage phiYS40]|uniref:hypothetical protein n=1 Tax=Thermus phage phiYS40 TaxID=407392 RepID=UPI0000E689FE|nr:hypothetical protein YS40_136 [Thermus phage phiYS40]ABJ91530.1 hypothetical protein YS40_136 [Thermus phage phiYS40]BAK53654.1 hypothetical protein YSP_136 [Thermus phage phiYS40]